MLCLLLKISGCIICADLALILGASSFGNAGDDRKALSQARLYAATFLIRMS